MKVQMINTKGKEFLNNENRNSFLFYSLLCQKGLNPIDTNISPVYNNSREVKGYG